MSPALTSHSNLDHLRKEAKRWLRAIRNGNAQALERLTAFYPHAPEAPSLRDVQHALALAYGATSWSTLKAALAEHAVENRSHEERVADFLRQACIRYDNDHPSSWREAACMLERHREIGRAGIHAACVSGEIDVVK